MSDELVIDGEHYISSKRASELSGYTQDYIGQLSRGGTVRARRVGGLWYIGKDSLEEHKERAELCRPAPLVPQKNAAPDTLLSFDGKGYISASQGSKLTGYTADYVGQLARAGTVLSRQVGNRWYVEREALLSHKERKDALLAAVQSKSVGIKQDAERLLKEREQQPLYMYTRDERGLLPDLFREQEEKNTTYFVPVHVLAGEETDATKDVNGDKQSMSHPGRLSGKTIFRAAVTGVALTIVIVLSTGFASLRSFSVYTNEAEIGNNAPMQSAGAGIVANTLEDRIERAGDILEMIFVPELVYQRTN